MLNTPTFLEDFAKALEAAFPGRIWFFGLQGSRARGDSREDSDIDLVVVLDELATADIWRYRRMLKEIPGSEQACGFFAGIEELRAWNPMELLQFCADTVPIVGSLDEIAALAGYEDVRRAVHAGCCDIYHSLVHDMIHEQDTGILADLYKAAGFVLRAAAFLEKGVFPRRLADLEADLSGSARGIVRRLIELRNGSPVDFEPDAERLFAWAQQRLQLFGNGKGSNKQQEDSDGRQRTVQGVANAEQLGGCLYSTL